MDKIRDPQQLGTNVSMQKNIAYLVNQGCTVIFDGLGVRVQQHVYRGSLTRVKKIRRESIELCVNAFNQGKWDN